MLYVSKFNFTAHGILKTTKIYCYFFCLEKVDLTFHSCVTFRSQNNKTIEL